ncbi:MAG: 50S ribosomal protein L10 [Candidatus Lokiarchaeota archaeon]|nr:50S ribosomal protein L10 [Candidatus Lokiarchaeota archaeon]
MTVSETKKVPEYKIKEVNRLKEIIKNNPVLGLTRIFRIESSMLQNIRKNLRGKVGIKVIKNNLFERAIDQVEKENLDKLKNQLEGATALIYTDLNPFKMKSLIEKNRSFTFAKAGYISPKDITVEAGDTGFPPGPIITELNEAGLRTRIKSGTIWVRETKTIVEEGEEISPMQAIVLSRLGKKPIELGLELYAAYDGTIYTEEDLDVDIEGILDNLKLAASRGYNLAIQINYPTSETIEPLIQKAHSHARSLVLQSKIIIKGYVDILLSLGNTQAKAIAQTIKSINPDALPEELLKSLGSEVEKTTTEEPQSDKQESEEKDSEEDEDEDTSVGLGGLFN